MRLVDADELSEFMTAEWFLDSLAANEAPKEIKKKIENVIDSVPLAYDVDKVVEELACNSRFIDDINEHNIKCISCVVGQKIAIDIVRKGGVE